MSKEAFETYIVVIGQRLGQRYAERKPLNVPLDLALGRHEDLSDLQLREAIQDLTVERKRREAQARHEAEVAKKCGGYDPFASQFRRSQ